MTDEFEIKFIDTCLRPFEEFEIHKNGSVYTCCPAWNYSYSIGNVFKQPFDEIWNSEKAIELRKKILEHDYSLCDKCNCHTLKFKDFIRRYPTDMKPVMTEPPKRVNFCYDFECNACCTICRDRVLTHSDEELSFLNSKIDTFFLPLLNGVKVLQLNGEGDPFASRHSRLLIKKAAEKYPDLRFDFLTNGILCNEKMFNELKITSERITSLSISLHSSTKETYGKVFRNFENKFDTVLNNLEFIKNFNTTGFFFGLSFVITADNYKDLPGFIEITEKYNATPFIWEYRPHQNSSENFNHADLIITDKNHEHYKELVKVLQHPILDKYTHRLSPILLQIREETF